MPEIKGIRVRNFRGLQLLELQPNGASVLAKGRNRAGKSSLLKAIRSLTSTKEISPEAIRKGENEAEVFVDLGDVTVQRVFTKDGKDKLTVNQRLGDVEVPMGKPATVLKSLFGDSLVDPVDLYLAKPKDRRDLVLAALPCSVTVEQLRKWVPGLPDSFDVSGHGLDVVARLHKQMYEARTPKNADAKRLRADADRLTVEADRLEAAAPKGAPNREEAQKELERARTALAALQEREAQAAKSEERTAKSRAKIAELRTKAAAEITDLSMPTDEERKVAAHNVEDAKVVVADLEKRLEAARRALEDARLVVQMLDARAASVTAARERHDGLLTQAEELEIALADAAVQAPTAEELDAVKRSLDDARRALATVDAIESAATARATANTARKAAEEAEEKAHRLDLIVDKLANEAPRELVAQSAGIPGLTIQGDSILLDGVDIERGCSGAEQLEFAVEIARRANAKSRVLVCDNLERLDGAEMKRFIELATAGGFQLFGARVEDHDLVVEAFEPTAAKQTNGKAAEQVSP